MLRQDPTRDISKTKKMSQNGGKWSGIRIALLNLKLQIDLTFYIFSMGAKFASIDKRVIVSPQNYNIPSKIIEK